MNFRQNIPVVAFGHTGAGKSTLLNLLIGKTLSVHNGQISCKNEIFKTSQKAISQTKDLQEVNVGKFTFVDTPGLKDTNIMDRTFNLIKLHQYIASHSLQIIIIIDVASIESERSSQAIELIQFIHNFFGDLQKLKTSTLLVMSHFMNEFSSIEILNQTLCNAIQERSKDTLTQINQKQCEDLCDFLMYLEKSDQILQFDKPYKNTVTNDECWDCHIGNKEMILQQLNKLTPVKNNILELNEQMLENEALYLINNEFPAQLKKYKDKLDKIIIKEYFIKQVLFKDTYKSQEQKKEFFQEELAKFQNINTFQDTYSQYFQKIIGLRQTLNSDKDKFFELASILISIKKLIKKTTIDNVLAFQWLRNVTSYYHCNKNEACGYFFQSSFIKEICDHQKCKQFVINTNIFIVDSNLTLPGVSLIIKCQKYLVITKNSTFDLTGRKGESIQQQRAQKGYDGLPGNPGHQGGNFLLIVKNDNKVKNLNKASLKIIQRGGEGGDGQNGGNGFDGYDGCDANLADVSSRSMCYLDKIEEMQCGNPFKGKYKFYFKSYGDYGQMGGDAGKGGGGGFPGNKGQHQILNFKGEDIIIYDFQISFITTFNSYGQPGSLGSPGRGGYQGRTAYAVYQDEFLFPSIQDQLGKLISEAKNYQVICSPCYLSYGNRSESGRVPFFIKYNTHNRENPSNQSPIWQNSYYCFKQRQICLWFCKKNSSCCLIN